MSLALWLLLLALVPSLAALAGGGPETAGAGAGSWARKNLLSTGDSDLAKSQTLPWVKSHSRLLPKHDMPLKARRRRSRTASSAARGVK